MAASKYPRRIEFLAELPKDQVGKIQRRKLREQLAGQGQTRRSGGWPGWPGGLRRSCGRTGPRWCGSQTPSRKPGCFDMGGP